MKSSASGIPDTNEQEPVLSLKDESKHERQGSQASQWEGNSQQYAYAAAEAAGANLFAPWRVVGAIGRDAGNAVMGTVLGHAPQTDEHSVQGPGTYRTNESSEVPTTKAQGGMSGTPAVSDALGGDDGNSSKLDNGILRDNDDREEEADGEDMRDIEDGLSKSSMSSTNISGDITTGGGGHYDPGKDALLRLETISTNETRHLNFALWGFLMVATAFLLYEFIQKLIDENAGAKSYKQVIVNIVVGSLLFAALTIAVGSHLYRMYLTVKFKRVWKPRRLKVTRLLFAEVFAQLNLVFFLVPNLMAFRDPCFEPTGNSDLGWLALARWTCWNTIFLLSVVHAHNSNPIGDPAGAWSALSKSRQRANTESGVDLPFLKLHWPKLIIWVLMEATTIATATYYTEADKRHGPTIVNLDAGQLCNPRYLQCGADSVAMGLVSLMVFWAVLYFVLYVYYIRRALELLKVRSNQDYRISNIIARLQMRMRLPAFAFFILSILLLWYVKPFSCGSLVDTWFGMLPVQIAASGTVIAMAFILSPKNVSTHNSPILQVWLQEHAWTEAEKPEKMAKRSSSLPPEQVEQIAKEPMFVMETAMKCLYWSFLAYDLHEVDPPTLSFEDGMGLFKLEHFHLFWDNKKGLDSTIKIDNTMGTVEGTKMDPKMDTKCLVAWSKDTILLSFRGTASMSNVLSDLQAFRTAHHPKRGSWWSRPLVHSGFQHAWRSNGLSVRVISFIKQTMKREGMKPNLVKFYVTGHSLGGALATLAAYDMRAIAKQFGNEANVSCYTFGAPRTGNHAFAREFMEMVPDCWHVINDQDIVVRGAKFVAAFKRGGHRVLINPAGDMIVRPAAIEASVRLLPGPGSVAQHLLTNYVRSFVAVLLAQFTHKRIKGGSSGVVELARANGPIQKLLLDEAGLTFNDLMRAWKWGPGALNSIQQKAKARMPNPNLTDDKEAKAQGGLFFSCCSGAQMEAPTEVPTAEADNAEDIDVVKGSSTDPKLA